MFEFLQDTLAWVNVLLAAAGLLAYLNTFWLYFKPSYALHGHLRMWQAEFFLKIVFLTVFDEYFQSQTKMQLFTSFYSSPSIFFTLLKK